MLLLSIAENITSDVVHIFIYYVVLDEHVCDSVNHFFIKQPCNLKFGGRIKKIKISNNELKLPFFGCKKRSLFRGTISLTIKDIP